MNKNYPSVAKHLNRIRSSFPGMAEAFRSEYRRELLSWMQQTYKEIINIKKDDEFRNRNVVDTLNENISALRSVIENLNDNLWSERWMDLVDELTVDLPDTVVEYQAKERFRISPDDSLMVQIQKKIKQSLRKISYIIKRDKTGWKQVIQLKKSVQLQLTVLSDLPDKLLANEFIVISGAVDRLLENEVGNSTEPESGEIRETGKPPGYRLQVMEQIEDHFQDAINRLKEVTPDESLVQRIADECFGIATVSGTVEDDRKQLEPKVMEWEQAFKREKLNKTQQDWIVYLTSQYSDFAIQVELARFSFLAVSTKSSILNLTHQFFRDFCYLPLETGITRIKEISETLKNQKSDTLSTKLVDDIRAEIEEELSVRLLDQMQNAEKQQYIINQIQKTITDLQLGFYSFTDTFTLAEKRSVENDTPYVTTDKVNWQKLASRYVKENALREMDPEKKEWKPFLKQIAGDVEEVIQIVDINLQTANESEKEKGENQTAQEIAIGGTERAVNRLEEAIKSVREHQDTYEKVIRETFPGAIQKLAETMLTRSYSELEMQDKALQDKVRAENWRARFKWIWIRLIEKAEVVRRFLLRKLKAGRKLAARYLGFEYEGAVSTTEKRNLAEYLVQVDLHHKFPFVYKRLFSYDFEVDERFYLPPSGLYQLFEQSFEDWKLNINTNFLLAGERGSGKTSANRFLRQKFLQDQKIVTIDFAQTIFDEKKLLKVFCEAFGFEPTENRDKLIQKIRRRRSRSVLIVENIHNIFVRNLHGFDAIESFWVIMASTRDNLFWLVSCSAFAWNFFVKVFGADQYFSHIVRTDNLTREETEKSILARHKATGYELKFEPGAAIQKRRAFKKIRKDETKMQEYLHDQYFEQLDKITEGNLSVAMIFWLQSIKEFDEKYVTQLPIEVMDLDKLEVPSREVLFTLSAFTLHENLKEDEISLALQQDLSESRLMLARLKSKGIVQVTDNDYRLNHLVYRQFVRLLKQRNIIH